MCGVGVGHANASEMFQKKTPKKAGKELSYNVPVPQSPPHLGECVT